ncbi:hypothetical protein LCGC14_0831520 [marine sediment metagenome]|uniref:Uncharacterized protein n=1 Tax=marine sediment metagenome TaxID=412755 RepID=A0A0F9SN04_9ZZZZ
MGLSTCIQAIVGSATRESHVSEQAEKFLEIFREACHSIPDTKILVDWMVFTLGVLSVHATETELNLIEDEAWRSKGRVRH